VRPNDIILQCFFEANVLVALACCVSLIQRSRAMRSASSLPGSPPKGGTFGVIPRPGGRDRLNWKTYNDYERCALWVALACLCEVVAFTDVTGAQRTFPWYVRGGNHGLIRWFFDLALFQMTSAYRTTLAGCRDNGFAIAGSVALVLQALTTFLEGYLVPPRGRVSGACWSNHANFVRNFGAGLLESAAICSSVRFALVVRARFKRDMSRTNYVRNQRVIRGIVMRIMMVGGISFVALLFGVYVGFRNVGTYYCQQPFCTFTDFLWGSLWAVAYVAVTWYCAIFLAVGRPSGEGHQQKRPRRFADSPTNNLFSRPSAIVRSPTIERLAAAHQHQNQNHHPLCGATSSSGSSSYDTRDGRLTASTADLLSSSNSGHAALDTITEPRDEDDIEGAAPDDENDDDDDDDDDDDSANDKKHVKLVPIHDTLFDASDPLDTLRTLKKVASDCSDENPTTPNDPPDEGGDALN